jgi:hypothetical protein
VLLPLSRRYQSAVQVVQVFAYKQLAPLPHVVLLVGSRPGDRHDDDDSTVFPLVRIALKGADAVPQPAPDSAAAAAGLRDELLVPCLDVTDVLDSHGLADTPGWHGQHDTHLERASRC